MGDGINIATAFPPIMAYSLWTGLLLLVIIKDANGLQLQGSLHHPPSIDGPRRRWMLQVAPLLLLHGPPALAAPPPNGLPLKTAASSGLQWADAKIGTGSPLQNGSKVAIDYSMASTAGRFPQIYTTKDKDTPYRWTLGDHSTIDGIEMAILGSAEDDMPPMLPGGIRRVIVPSKLGYLDLARPNAKCDAGALGPIPPSRDDSGAYQRWAQFYCNPRIPYQPDLVLDIKLYGKRTP